MMPILYLTNDELAERIKSRDIDQASRVFWRHEKAPAVPFDAFEFQRRYRLKAMQAREDRLLVLWALVALVTGVLLVVCRTV